MKLMMFNFVESGRFFYYGKMSRDQREHRITGKGLSGNLTRLMVSACPYKSVQFESLKQMYLAREDLFRLAHPRLEVRPAKDAYRWLKKSFTYGKGNSRFEENS